MLTQRLNTLVAWLSGEFQNADQSQAQPIWFVSLRLWYRAIPSGIAGKTALFAEQAPALTPTQAYRQRVLLLWIEADRLNGQYWAFKQPSQFMGSGAQPEPLRSLSESDLEPLPGCRLAIEDKGDRFVAELEPGAKCCFDHAGKTRQVIVGFEVSANRLLSFDRGIDPDTGKLLWGALMGPYEFTKC
jgi:hypothetical protein